MAVQELDVFGYEYDEDSATVKVNVLGSVYGASIEDYPEVMSRIVGILTEVPDAESIVLVENREYEYDPDQIHLLREVANAIQDISTEGYLSENPDNQCSNLFAEHLPEVQNAVVDQLRRDPVGAYVKLKRMKRHLKEEQNGTNTQRDRCIKYFFNEVLDPVKNRLESMEIVQRAYDHDYITGHHVGDREVYREFFHPLVRPNFMLTKYQSLPPERGEEIERYTVMNDVEISIYRVPDMVQPVYHVKAPEFQLSEEKYSILDAARRFMASHEPQSGEFARPERMRQTFENIGRDMLRDISNQMNIPLAREEIENLTGILNRYTSGLGVLELILSDPKVQDVFVNSPVGDQPIYIKHQDYEECKTNMIPTQDEAESWATRFRIQSGRPLDEANPVLDTETKVPGGRARVAIIQENLSPEGLAFAFRRHRSRAWTYPLFIDSDFMNPMAAGLLSFIVDGNRSVLFSGTRGAGKSSILGASMLEIMRKHRVCTVEDTLELPIQQMKDLGYNIERMKSRSVITQVDNELGADEAIRTSLRLGDSALVIGEVRSDEAKTLYEAMRVGAVANFVGGTIHGESPYAVFDRVVNDLGVPPTSFKATDVIVSVNKIRSPDGLDTYRRVTGITEVLKDWEDDPSQENGFRDLMRYDSNDDELKPTDTLLNGESMVLNRIAENIREWKNDWEAVWDNIQLRKKMKKRIVERAHETDNMDLLEAEFTTEANQRYHKLAARVSDEYGEQDPERIYARWNEWLKRNS